MFFVCGQWAYFYFPPGWYGSCYLAYILPRITHFTDLWQITRQGHRPGRMRRTPQWADDLMTGLGALIPGAGVVYTSVRVHQLARIIEDLANSTVAGLENITEELTEMRAVVIQNRVVLTIILAKDGGVCHVIHQRCCSWISDNSQNIDRAIHQIKNVRDEARGIHTGHMWEDIMLWIKSWGSWILKVIIVAVAVLITVCVVIQVCPACCSAFVSFCAHSFTRNKRPGEHERHHYDEEGIEMVMKE